MAEVIIHSLSDDTTPTPVKDDTKIYWAVAEFQVYDKKENTVKEIEVYLNEDVDIYHLAIALCKEYHDRYIILAYRNFHRFEVNLLD